MDISLIKNFRNLTVWQFINKFIGIFYFSILTILLGPYNYGILALVLAIYEVASIGFIGINNGLQRYISEKHQKIVLISGLKLALGLSFIISILLIIFKDYLSKLFSQDLSSFILLLVLVLLVGSLKEVLLNTLFGIKYINAFIFSDVVFTFSRLGLVSLFLFLSFGVSGVLIGLALANLLSALTAFLFIRKFEFSKDGFNTKKLFSYSTKFVFIALIYQLQPQVFIFYLSKLKGILDVGYYKFLFNLIIIVIVSIPQTLSFLIFPYMSEYIYKKSKNDVENLFNSSFKIALYLSIVMSVIFYFLIGFVVNNFFKDYTAAIEYIPFFLLFAIFQSLGFISSTLMKATDNLAFYIKLTLIILITSLIFTPLLIKIMGVHGAILSYSIVMFLVTLILTFKITKKAEIKLHLMPSKYDIALVKKLFKGAFSKL